MLVPAGSPIFFLIEHRFARASWVLGSVFLYVVYYVIIDDEVFIIYILLYIH